MPTRLFLVTVSGIEEVDFPDDVLVLQGNGDYTKPGDATSVMRYLPFLGEVQLTEVLAVCRSEYIADVEYPDPNIPTIVDPTDGDCVCGVTCEGTQLDYVEVVAL